MALQRIRTSHLASSPARIHLSTHGMWNSHNEQLPTRPENDQDLNLGADMIRFMPLHRVTTLAHAKVHDSE